MPGTEGSQKVWGRENKWLEAFQNWWNWTSLFTIRLITDKAIGSFKVENSVRQDIGSYATAYNINVRVNKNKSVYMALSQTLPEKWNLNRGR